MIKKIILFLLIPCSGFGAVVMPTGIPAPPFGLEETVLSIHGDVDYYTHWVDNTAGNCSDGGNGTPSIPRCTIPVTTSLAAGTVVQLRGGPYSLSGSDKTIGGTGTSGSPIFFRGPSWEGRVEIGLSSVKLLISGSYIIFENIKTTGRDEAISPYGSDHCSIRYCEVVGTGTSVDGSGGAIGGGGTSYLVRAYNTIRDVGDWQATIENDLHGLSVGSGQTYTWDLFNTVYHCGGDGSGNGHDANHTTHDLYIGGNVYHDNRENGIDLKEVHNVIISGNSIYNQTDSSTASGEAIVIHYGPTSGEGPYNVWVINNLIHNAVRGYAGSDIEAGNYIIGNVFYNISGAAIDLNASSGGWYYIYHNTIVDSATGENYGVSTQALDFGGNIVSNCSAYHMRVDTTTEADTIATVANELYWQNGSDLSIGWKTSTYPSVTAWQTASGKGSGSLQVDPLFVNATAYNYRLQSGSPAINAGVDMGAINDIFQSTFGEGVSILQDIAGTSRPVGSAWDIGAYEYTDGGPYPIKVRGFRVRAD